LSKSALQPSRKRQFDDWAEHGKIADGKTRQGINENTARILWGVMCAIGWNPNLGNSFLFGKNGKPWEPKPQVRNPNEYQIAGVTIPRISILQSYIDEPVSVDMIECSFSESAIPSRLEG